MRVQRSPAQRRRCRAPRIRRRWPRCRRRGPRARRRRWRCGRTPSGAAPPRPRRPSRPRRSSPAARRAAARRSPAGPRAAVTRVATSGPWATSSSHNGSLSAEAASRSSSSPISTAPMRCRIRKKPTRVQLAAIPAITMRERGTSTAAAAWKAADDGSPGTCDRLQQQLVLAVDGDAVRRAGDPGAGARQQALRVVAARLRLDHRGRALGEQPGQQQAALDLRRRDGQHVLDPPQRPARDLQRREAAVAGLELGAHLARAGRRCGRPAGGGCSRRRRAPSARRRAARRASPAAAAAACPRCRRRSPRPRWPSAAPVRG